MRKTRETQMFEPAQQTGDATSSRISARSRRANEQERLYKRLDAVPWLPKTECVFGRREYYY